MVARMGKQNLNRAARRVKVVFIFGVQGAAVMEHPTDTPGVSGMADGLAATLRTARALCDAGRPIDLTGLQDMVGVLCAHVLDLPLVEGRQMRATLEMLDHEIGLLLQAMPEAAEAS
jgi:hypothetical protein